MRYSCDRTRRVTDIFCIFESTNRGEAFWVCLAFTFSPRVFGLCCCFETRRSLFHSPSVFVVCSRVSTRQQPTTNKTSGARVTSFAFPVNSQSTRKPHNNNNNDDDTGRQVVVLNYSRQIIYIIFPNPLDPNLSLG